MNGDYVPMQLNQSAILKSERVLVLKPMRE